MAMSSERASSEIPHTSVRETLMDHEERITTNERWRLLLKGAIVGLSLASGSDRVIEAVLALV